MPNMRMLYRTTSGLIALVILLAPTRLDAQGPSSAVVTTQAPFTSSVLGTEARFVFPLPPRTEWEWYRATTGDMKREYRFSVELQNGEERYELGFFLFKIPGAAPTRGDVSALLRAGQASIARVVGGRGSVLRDRRARLMVAANRLMVVVDDEDTLRLLFSERPNEATFNIDIPGEQTATRQVTIVYGQP